MSQANREIKRRIRSVGNTKKITKAMELVAAAKMRKAVDAVLATRSYANAAWQIVQDLSARTDPRHSTLLQSRDAVQRIGVILITSNRGLCGGFNREIIEQTVRFCRQQQQIHADCAVDIYLMGKRGQDIWHKYGYKVVAEFEKQDVATSSVEVSALAKMVIADYINGKYDKIVLAYTDYHSAIRQEPRLRQLLPVTGEDEALGQVNNRGESEQAQTDAYEYIFEPSPAVVLEQMLYRLIELQAYQGLLESNASEHSARMMAMRNASDAASDMIDDLTLTYNQARQQAITTELADISAGTAAVT